MSGFPLLLTVNYFILLFHRILNLYRMNRINIELKWAFVFLVMSLLWMLLEKWTGVHSTHLDKHQYVSLLFAIPAIAVYYFALTDKKKTIYAGQMSFKQGLFSGLLLTLIITLLSPVSQWFVSTVITPDYFNNVIAYSLETGYYATRKQAEAYFNLNNYIVQSILGAISMGIITSVIIAFIVKSKKSAQK